MNLALQGWLCVALRKHNNWNSLLVRDQVLAEYPFTDEAVAYIRTLRFYVKDPDIRRGGGFWYGAPLNLIWLYTVQREAAIHEMAHAWWDHIKTGELQRRFLADTCKLAVRDAGRWPRIGGLARDYILGCETLPHGMWLPGGRINCTEIYAGLASGSMGDMALLSPYLQSYYRGLFEQS